MWEFEQRLVRESGYRIEGDRIWRESVIDVTLWEQLTETQRVHRYKDFMAEPPEITVELGEGSLEGLEAETIMLLIGQANRDLEAWGELIFGKVEAGKKGVVENPAPMEKGAVVEQHEALLTYYEEMAERAKAAPPPAEPEYTG
jgi:hypothetical protein